MLNNATAFYKRASRGGFLCRVFSGVLHSLFQRVLHSYFLITSCQEALVVASGVILSLQVGAASVVRNVAGFVPTGFVPTGFVRVYHQHGLCSRVGT